MVPGSGAFGRGLDPEEDGTLMNWITALVKEDPESSLAPPHHANTQREDGYDPGRGSSPVGYRSGTLILDLSASEPGEIHFCRS